MLEPSCPAQLQQTESLRLEDLGSIWNNMHDTRKKNNMFKKRASRKLDKINKNYQNLTNRVDKTI